MLTPDPSAPPPSDRIAPAAEVAGRAGPSYATALSDGGLAHVLGRLDGEFAHLSPETVAALRAEVERRAAAAAPPVDPQAPGAANQPGRALDRIARVVLPRPGVPDGVGARVVGEARVPVDLGPDVRHAVVEDRGAGPQPYEVVAVPAVAGQAAEVTVAAWLQDVAGWTPDQLRRVGLPPVDAGEARPVEGAAMADGWPTHSRRSPGSLGNPPGWDETTGETADLGRRPPWAQPAQPVDVDALRLRAAGALAELAPERLAAGLGRYLELVTENGTTVPADARPLIEDRVAQVIAYADAADPRRGQAVDPGEAVIELAPGQLVWVHHEDGSRQAIAPEVIFREWAGYQRAAQATAESRLTGEPGAHVRDVADIAAGDGARSTRLSVATNAAGWAMFAEGRPRVPSTTGDAVPTILLSDLETAQAAAVAARVLDHVDQYDGTQDDGTQDDEGGRVTPVAMTRALHHALGLHHEGPFEEWLAHYPRLVDGYDALLEQVTAAVIDAPDVLPSGSADPSASTPPAEAPAADESRSGTAVDPAKWWRSEDAAFWALSCPGAPFPYDDDMIASIDRQTAAMLRALTGAACRPGSPTLCADGTVNDQGRCDDCGRPAADCQPEPTWRVGAAVASLAASTTRVLLEVPVDELVKAPVVEPDGPGETPPGVLRGEGWPDLDRAIAHLAMASPPAACVGRAVTVNLEGGVEALVLATPDGWVEWSEEAEAALSGPDPGVTLLEDVLAVGGTIGLEGPDGERVELKGPPEKAPADWTDEDLEALARGPVGWPSEELALEWLTRTHPPAPGADPWEFRLDTGVIVTVAPPLEPGWPWAVSGRFAAGRPATPRRIADRPQA